MTGRSPGVLETRNARASALLAGILLVSIALLLASQSRLIGLLAIVLVVVILGAAAGVVLAGLDGMRRGMGRGAALIPLGMVLLLLLLGPIGSVLAIAVLGFVAVLATALATVITAMRRR